MELLLETNFVKKITDVAKIEIKKNTEREFPIFGYLENFAKTNELIIGNDKLIDGTFVYWESVDLYGYNSEDIATRLLTDLCNTYGKKFTMRSIEWINQYHIEYKSRVICNIYTLNIHCDLEKVIKRDPYLVNDMYVLPPILEIIAKYTMLCNPRYAERWGSILQTTQNIEKHFQRNGYMDDTRKVNGITKTDRMIAKMGEIILDYIRDSDYILVGETAYNLSDNPISIDISKPIEIISKNDIEFDYKSIKTYINRFVKTGIVYAVVPVALPNEHMLKCHHLYVIHQNKKKHFMTIYNNTAYELISYLESKGDGGIYEIADPIPQLRFLYTQIWLDYTHSIKSDPVIFDLIQYYREKIDITTIKQFSGVYLDLNVELKKLNIKNPNIGKYVFYCNSVL